jgi:hypothetical protein
MSADGTMDSRRFGVIEVRYRAVGKLAMYDLTSTAGCGLVSNGRRAGKGGAFKTPAAAV